MQTLLRLHRCALVAMNYLSSIFLFIVMAFIVLDVIARTLFSSPLDGVPEIVRFSIVVFLWLQVGQLIHSGRLIKATLLVDAGGPWFRWSVQLLADLLGLALFAAVLYYSAPELAKAVERGSFEGEWPVRIPLWPIWSVIILGALFSAIEFLRRAGEGVRQLVRGEVRDA